MKKFIFTLIMVSSVAFAFSQQYVIRKDLFEKAAKLQELQGNKGPFLDANLDLEDWDLGFETIVGKVPTGWALMTGNKDVQQITGAENVQSGNYAMHLESNITSHSMFQWHDTLVGGFGLVGKLGMGVNPGEVYTKRPIKMSFYYKGEMKDRDTSLVHLKLVDASDVVVAEANCFFNSNDLTDQWQKKTLMVEYFNENEIVKALLVASSSGHGIYKNVELGTITAGSYLELDNFNLEFASSGIADKNMQEISMYPNPARDFTTIENMANSQLSIFDMAGHLVLEKEITDNNETVNLSKLIEGLYIVKIKKDGKVFSKKLNIIRWF